MTKYGRMFTEGDVEKILEWVEENTNPASAIDFDGILAAMDEEARRRGDGVAWPLTVYVCQQCARPTLFEGDRCCSGFVEEVQVVPLSDSGEHERLPQHG